MVQVDETAIRRLRYFDSRQGCLFYQETSLGKDGMVNDGASWSWVLALWRNHQSG